MREIISQLNYKLFDTQNEKEILKQRLFAHEREIDNLKAKESEYIRHYEGREDEFLRLLSDERYRVQQYEEQLNHLNQ